MRSSASWLWVNGVARHRGLRLMGAAGGVAIAVSLMSILGAFLSASEATMTQRARAAVAVDWQVQVQTGGDSAAIGNQLIRTAGNACVIEVPYGQSTGLTASSAESTQTTGPGLVLGLAPDYRSTFPEQVRQLAGSPRGVQVAQQTASNLKIVPGDQIVIGLPGASAVTVTVAGVVDLPQANSLFQHVGAPPQSQPSAPPDNVLLLPTSQFSQIYSEIPTQVSTQFHVRRNAQLPAEPAHAFTAETAAARNVEATAAGTALVGDNLGAALGAARADAAYARMLFLFLGLPGVILAALLTSAVVSAGTDRRRTELALLRTRGFSRRGLIQLALAETTLIATLGSAAGLAVAAMLSRTTLGLPLSASGSTVAAWAGIAVLVGVLVAFTTTLLPLRRDLRAGGAQGSSSLDSSMRRSGQPWWLRCGLDVVLILLAGVVFWASSGNNYSLVLAPEGVPTMSVSYWAFLGPALLWLGAAGLLTRLILVALRHGRSLLERLLRPLAGRLAIAGAASMSRRRSAMARAIVLLALSLAFAASTATFNATYAQQAEADALLTNGADVTVTFPAGVQSPLGLAEKLSALSGVQGVEGVQHRFAYVGADLQDLYGVNPATISTVTALQDAYFTGGTAAQVLGRLQAQPDAIIVSAETVKDYQLSLGDTLHLRLPDPRGGPAKTVPFRYAGIVNEFPTAPKDSFFVANADYLAAATGDASANTFLLNTNNTAQPGIADEARSLVGTGATITDITQVRGRIGSSLTSVSLAGLTWIELGYAIMLSVAAGGLVLGLGIAERRRTSAILSVLGAGRAQLSGLIAGEGVLLLVGGVAGGTAIGVGLSWMLVKVLTGVFDPAPSSMAIPTQYLVSTVLAVAVALASVALLGTRSSTGRPAVEVLREL